MQWGWGRFGERNFLVKWQLGREEGWVTSSVDGIASGSRPVADFMFGY
jgi:hypothetical protein